MASSKPRGGAGRRAGLKGRVRIGIGLVAFSVVTGVIVWRRSVGAATEKQMAQLRTERRALASKRVTLMRELREATERRVIVPAAEAKLGLHVATEAQTRMLSDSSAPPPGN